MYYCTSRSHIERQTQHKHLKAGIVCNTAMCLCWITIGSNTFGHAKIPLYGIARKMAFNLMLRFFPPFSSLFSPMLCEKIELKTKSCHFPLVKNVDGDFDMLCLILQIACWVVGS